MPFPGLRCCGVTTSTATLASRRLAWKGLSALSVLVCVLSTPRQVLSSAPALIALTSVPTGILAGNRGVLRQAVGFTPLGACVTRRASGFIRIRFPWWSRILQVTSFSRTFCRFFHLMILMRVVTSDVKITYFYRLN